MTRKYSGAVAAACLLATPAMAIQQPPGGPIIYEAAFFESASPSTALDIVSRVPGFQIEDGDDVRGFSGAVGNVLINGSRPASKVETPSQVLARIPARRVLRVELIRGGAAGIDMQGRSAVVNVVLSEATETSEALQAEFQAFEQGPFLWGAQYERRSSQLDNEWSLQLGRGIYTTDSTGPGRLVRFAPDGSELLREAVDNKFDAHTWTASAGWERRFGDNRIEITGSGTLTDYRDRIIYDSAAETRRFDFAMDLADFDAALVWQRALSTSLDLEVRLLQSYGEADLQSEGLIGSDAQRFSTSRQAAESIARASLTHQRSPTFSAEIGGELAFNWLDARQSFAVNAIEIPLPQATTQVDELRGEVFANTRWQRHENLRIETGLRLEQSVISQSGDGSARRSFFYAKPRLSATWDAAPSTQLRLRLEREIGQLNFLDFAASSNLANDQVLGGNIDLRPVQRWVAELAAEVRFAGDGVLTLTLRHDELDDVVDLLPLPGGLTATGNLGAGRLDRIALNARLPLRRLGLERGRLIVSWRYDWLRVADPVTGEDRGISFNIPRTASLRFENEVPSHRLSWGADYMPFSSSPTYDPDQTRFYRVRDQFALFAERRFGEGVSLRAEINLWNDLEISRTVFADRSATRPVLFTEQQSFDPRNRVQLRLRRSF
jgi:hypothetical protein